MILESSHLHSVVGSLTWLPGPSDIVMSTLNLELYIPEALGRAVTSSLSLDSFFCLWCFLGVLWQDFNSGITLKEPVLNCRLQRYTNVPAHTVFQQPTLFFSYYMLSWEPKSPLTWRLDLWWSSGLGGRLQRSLCLHHCLAHSGHFTYLLQDSTLEEQISMQMPLSLET